MTKAVVFVHGAWVTPACWDLFKERYEERGYACLAPAWPYDDRPVEQLRRNPAPELAAVGLRDIADHYATVVAGLDEPPIIIGHSFGGLITQMLLDRGLGAAGVAIDPAPPRGVLPGPSAVRSSFPVLRSWRGWKKVLRMSFEQFRHGFVHQLPGAEQREAYERHVVPTPGRPFFQAAFGKDNRVDFRNDSRAPLLITAGKVDRTVTSGMNRANFKKYARSEAITDFKEFAGRSHWVIAEPGWQEVADHVIEWAEKRTGR